MKQLAPVLVPTGPGSLISGRNRRNHFMTQNTDIVIFGIGCTLISDQGFGVSVVQSLDDNYTFPPAVKLVDGGLVGVALTGVIGSAKHLIVIDAIHNQGRAGTIYRLAGDAVLERLNKKNSVLQVEFLEALAHCQLLDNPPETVLLGIEPEDTETVACTLTPVLSAKVDAMVAHVLKELDRLSVDYCKKRELDECV